MPPEKNIFYTLKDISQRYQVHKTTIWRWTKAGKIRPVPRYLLVTDKHGRPKVKRLLCVTREEFVALAGIIKENRARLSPGLRKAYDLKREQTLQRSPAAGTDTMPRGKETLDGYDR